MCGADIFARERWRDPAHLLAYGKFDFDADRDQLRPQITVSPPPEEDLGEESIPVWPREISVSLLTQRVRRNTMAGLRRQVTPVFSIAILWLGDCRCPQRTRENAYATGNHILGGGRRAGFLGSSRASS